MLRYAQPLMPGSGRGVSGDADGPAVHARRHTLRGDRGDGLADRPPSGGGNPTLARCGDKRMGRAWSPPEMEAPAVIRPQPQGPRCLADAVGDGFELAHPHPEEFRPVVAQSRLRIEEWSVRRSLGLRSSWKAVSEDRG